MMIEMSESELLPTTYLTVLTLIGRGAKYGYEINELIERHGYREWVDLQFSSIYKALNQLESKGLIKGKKEDVSVKGSKKVYSLTRNGKRILKNQILECLSNPPRSYTVFDLGLSAMSYLSKEDALAALQEYRQNLSHSIEFLSGQVDTLRNIDVVRTRDPSTTVGQQRASDFKADTEIEVVIALFERPLRSLESQAEWLDSFVDRVRDGRGFTFKKRRRKENR